MGKLSRADSGVSSQLPLGSLTLTTATKSSGKAASTKKSSRAAATNNNSSKDVGATEKQHHSGDKRSSPVANKENAVPINKVLKVTKARKSLVNNFDAAEKTDSDVAAKSKPAVVSHDKLTAEALPVLLQSVELVYHLNTTTMTKLTATLRQHVPLTPAKYDTVYAAIKAVVGERHMQRIETQLLAFSNTGAISHNHLPLYCQSPQLYSLYCNKCKQSSMMQAACTQCGVDGKHLTIHNGYNFMHKLTKKQLKQNSTDASTTHEPHPLMDPAEMLAQREACTLRAIACLKKLAKKTEGFTSYGGDVLFLLRNAIFRGKPTVSTAARDAVTYMLNKWDGSDNTILDTYAEVEHLMGYAECLHAKIELKWHDDKQLERLRSKVHASLSHVSVNDILRFDPSTASCIPQTDAGYCVECGTFQPLRQVHCTTHTDKKLTQEREFEAMTESLVWTSVFADCGVQPFAANDAKVTLPDVLRFMKDIRPYQSLTTLGRDSYITQSYWITHLIFIMSGWGACQLDRQLFLDELLYMSYNMDVVIKLGDAELVGEYLHSLHILGIDKQEQCMLKGYFYLLTNEVVATKDGVKSGTGNWVKTKETYHKQYHTAYTGVIGLADMQFDKQDKAEQYLPKQWHKYFE